MNSVKNCIEIKKTYLWYCEYSFIDLFIYEDLLLIYFYTDVFKKETENKATVKKKCTYDNKKNLTNQK